MPKMAALIMAAGQASRFGECKQLTTIKGKPLLQHSIDIAQSICPGHVFALSGAWHNETSTALQSRKINNVILINHPGWADGLGSSIARGVNFLSEDFDSILIMLADQIALTKTDLIGLQNQFGGDNIVCGFYAGRRGVPAIFGQNSFVKLKQLHGENGAKSLLYDQDVPVVEYPIEHAIFDIDTSEDLRMWITDSHKRSMREAT